ATPPASAYSPSTPLSASYEQMFYNCFNYVTGVQEKFLSKINFYDLTQNVKDIVYNSGNTSYGFYVTLSGNIIVENNGNLSAVQPPINITIHYR
ncbi:hypothetical protein EBR43_10060, partial [bacterium]|nr:hypothetical protein [bacterium]